MASVAATIFSVSREAVPLPMAISSIPCFAMSAMIADCAPRRSFLGWNG